MSESKPLTADDIVKAADRDLVPKRVEIPGWGGHAFIRGMTDEDRDEYETWVAEAREQGMKTAGMRREFVARTLVDAAGKRLFLDGEVLKGKSARVIDVLYGEASKYNGLDADAVEDAKKNSELTPPPSSATG